MERDSEFRTLVIVCWVHVSSVSESQLVPKLVGDSSVIWFSLKRNISAIIQVVFFFEQV